jgi:hypothetical protein
MDSLIFAIQDLRRLIIQQERFAIPSIRQIDANALELQKNNILRLLTDEGVNPNPRNVMVSPLEYVLTILNTVETIKRNRPLVISEADYQIILDNILPIVQTLLEKGAHIDDRIRDQYDMKYIDDSYLLPESIRNILAIYVNNLNPFNPRPMNGLPTLSIPKNAKNAIMFGSINMNRPIMNFHNEHTHGRYYQDESTIRGLERTRQNPFTRSNIVDTRWYRPIPKNNNNNEEGKKGGKQRKIRTHMTNKRAHKAKTRKGARRKRVRNAKTRRASRRS